MSADKTWNRLKTVSELLRQEEDSTGQIKNGEGRALQHDLKQLQRDLGSEAYKILKAAGFTGTGLKSKRRR